MKWNEVKDVSSLGSFLSSQYFPGATSSATKPSPKLDPISMENGLAEYNAGKRKIIWRLKNVKG